MPGRRGARRGGQGDADTARGPVARAGSGGPNDTTRAGESRTFPPGSYVVRMDQPYSRIADALLDYQYWSPNDPQKNPYDDTGWTFPESFAVQTTRVIDPKALSAPMEPVQGEVKP